MRKIVHFFIVVALTEVVLSFPSDNSFVVSSTESSGGDKKEGATDENAPQHPMIYEMDISSNISNRFAKTLITSKVKNAADVAKETTFTVVLPEKAFISEFVMEIGGKSYKAYVKEKEEAKQIYEQAVSSGQSAGHVAVSARNSNKFTVSVNTEPASKVVFLLTYEELLERKKDSYELILNIHPGQIVKDLNIKVQINETRPLKFVKTPSLRSGNEISKNEDKLDPSSDIEIVNSTTAVVKFSPDAEKQKQFATELGNKESDGLSGQFVVQYDVERDPHGGEILLQDGYFVHFFAPTELKPLAKHVMFVLDSSGSMAGKKIEQVRDAMHSILKEIKEEDIISVIDFGSNVNVWDIAHEKRTKIEFGEQENFEEPFSKLSIIDLPAPIEANKDNIAKTIRVTDTLEDDGGTFMIGGLETALYLAKVVQDRGSEKKYQPIIIFLTDGAPNVGLYSREDITRIVTRLNAENNAIPIFSLSFGVGADKDFLRELSLKNQGFSRHIYEAADASLQLQEFYKQISSPLLSNITFKYNPDAKEITKTKFPIYFKGSEIVVTGRYDGTNIETLPQEISSWGIDGRKILKPIVEKPVTSVERLWAYLTIKQALDEKELSKSKEEKEKLTKKASDLALKYSFVTDLTSLVVVKPNETSHVDTVDASSDSSSGYVGQRGLAFFGKSSVSKRRFGIPGPRIGSAGSVGWGTSSSRFYSSNVAQSYFPSANIYRTEAFQAPFDSAVLIAGPSPVPLLPQPPSSAATHGILSTTVAPTYDKLLRDLPWLASVLSANKTITIEQNAYELGEANTIITPATCSNAPTNSTQTAQCVLLKDCPEVYSSLTDFQAYKQHFCPIDNRYAGICCPRGDNI